MSAEARSECPEPTALEEGGRKVEVLLASGVLFLFPMTWLPDILCIIKGECKDKIVCSGKVGKL